MPTSVQKIIFTEHLTSHKVIVCKIYVVNVCKGLLEPCLKDALEEDRIVDTVMSWIPYPYQDRFCEEKLQK